ncbi:MAG: beta-ketoacyl-ACP synthase II [Anaerolineaceae bacterium]|nr:beta-ketoacyl-ACP synthase II [Anaerolineaceae bacterium]
MPMRRVVVTGVGLVTPVGQGVADSWQALCAGRSGAGFITRFDPASYRVKIAAEVSGWDPTQHMSARDARRLDRYQQMALVAAREALAHSGLEIDECNADRTGVIVGSAVGGVESYFKQAELLVRTGDPRRITPFGIPMLMVNGASGLISIETGASGPGGALISACATGADSIGRACELIRAGRIDQALAGCSDAPIIPIGVGAFDRVGACSREDLDPASASRPFDLNRTGLVFGEGAGVLVLEALEVARKRNATVLAELAGYGSTSDAFHSTAPDPEGRGAAAAITFALRDAGLEAKDIDYINAHGTATRLNDVMETKALKLALGASAYEIPVSSTKSMTGHAMGATAAMEAVFSILALRDQLAPPTINLNEPDPDCDLDYVPNETRELPLTRVMTNAFGFGGHNASLIFSRM